MPALLPLLGLWLQSSAPFTTCLCVAHQRTYERCDRPTLSDSHIPIYSASDRALTKSLKLGDRQRKIKSCISWQCPRRKNLFATFEQTLYFLNSRHPQMRSHFVCHSEASKIRRLHIQPVTFKRMQKVWMLESVTKTRTDASGKRGIDILERSDVNFRNWLFDE